MYVCTYMWKPTQTLNTHVITTCDMITAFDGGRDKEKGMVKGGNSDGGIGVGRREMHKTL